MRYFVNYHTRMVRTIHPGDREPPAEWTEVIAQGYDQFRKISKIFFTSSTERQARKVGNGKEMLLKAIERMARGVKKEEGCTLEWARDCVAAWAGYANYEAAKEVLSKD